MEASKLDNERERIAALYRYGILDTPRESDFDEVVSLASMICQTPISVVNLIDEERQWFKAEIGLGVRETPLESSICAHAILQKDFLEVQDTLKDPRFRDNPLCIGEPNLRFYAGALLQTSGGLPLGTLCVLDYRPRQLNEEQRFALSVLARQVMAQIELRHRLSTAKLMMKEIDHRVKNSLNQVSSLLNLQASAASTTEARDQLNVARNRVAAVADLHAQLHVASNGEAIDAAAFLQRLVAKLSVSAGDRIIVSIQTDSITLSADIACHLGLLVNELVTNALQHSLDGHDRGKVQVSLVKGTDYALLSVHDNGRGLPHDFELERSSGLGMKLAVLTARKLGGELAIAPQSSGACFSVQFPVPA